MKRCEKEIRKGRKLKEFGDESVVEKRREKTLETNQQERGKEESEI